MLHHFSVSVANPLHASRVVSEILQGEVVPFGIFAGSYIVLKGDKYGTAIEFLPSGIEMRLKNRKLVYECNSDRSLASGSVATVSVPIDRDEIEKIAKREGWLTRPSIRLDGKAIEFWIENQIVIELIPCNMLDEYIKSMKAPSSLPIIK